MRLYTFVIKNANGTYNTKTLEAENFIHAMFYLDDEEYENVTSIASHEINQGEGDKPSVATDA